MNRVYKVIYNRARNLYQVVSEIVHSRGKTKSLTAQHQHERLTTAILIALFAMGTSLPVGWADPAVSTEVTKDDANAVSSGAVYTEVRPTDDMNTKYVKSKQTTADNLKALDTQVKQNADAIAQKADTTALDAKADKTDLAAKANINLDNISLDNLSDNGKQVIQALLNIQDSDNVTVSSSTDDTTKIKTFTITVNTNGAVVSGNAGLVTGDTVYREVRPSANGTYVKVEKTTAENLTALDRQVNTNTTDISGLKNLSNISTDGKTVIKSLLSVVGDNDQVTVTPSDDVNGAKTYTVTVKKDGTIAADSDNLVTGKTVYEYLNSKVGTLAQDGNYIKRADSVSTNLSTLDTQIKNVIDAIGLDPDNTTTSYTSKLNKYFKVNPRSTTTDGTTTYDQDAAANGTNSVAIGPSAQAGEKTTDTTTSTTTVTGGTSSTAIGDRAKANGNQSVALGYGSQVLNTTDQSGKTTATISGSTAIGNGAKVNGATDATAVGTSAQVNETATGGIAFGKNAATGEDKGTVTVGDVTADVAAVGGENSVALGTSAKASGNTALALGNGAQVNNYTTQSGTTVTKKVNSGSTAIGNGATVTGANDAVALGSGASITGTGTNADDSMSIGKRATVATAKDAMALGTSASVASGADNAIAIGNTAKANTSNTTAIGYNATATGAGAVAIGENTSTSTEGGISIGSGTSVSGKSIAIGYATDNAGNAVKTESNNTDAVAIGNGAQANANDSISIGHQAGKDTAEGRASGYGSLIAIGTNAGNNVKGMQNVALGSGAGSNVKSSYNVAIGSNAGAGINYAADKDSNPQNGYNVSIGYEANYQSADANAKNIAESIAIGHSANAVSNATAMGYQTTASGDKSMAFGYNATAADTDSIAFGDNASAGGGNIAIGHGSQAPAVTSYSSSYLTNNKKLNGYISLGGKTTATSNDRILRRITNVADGSDDQDAVTVAQLKAAYTNLEGTIKTTDTKISDTYTQEAIDTKIKNVESKITASKIKYFSINTSSDTLTANADSDGASTSGAADAMAIGPNASASSSKAVAIGNNVSASGKGSIALGTADNPATTGTVDVGKNTSANPHVTSAEGANSVAIGTSAIAQTDNSVALGTRASVYTSDVTDKNTGTTTKVGQQSIAIGYQAETRNSNAISIGSDAKAYSNGSTAIGHGAYAQGADAIVLGTSSRANGASSGILGKSNTINGSNTYAVGSENKVNGNWGAVTYSGLYGSNNTVNPVADTSGNTKHGMDSLSVTGNSNTISQGSYSDTVQNISILGNSNSVTGASGDEANAGTTANITVIGGNNEATGRDGAGSDYMGKTWNQLTRTSIIGYGNKVNQKEATTSLANTQILGNDVTATLGNSVYLGTGSSAKNANSPDTDTLVKAETDAADAVDTTGMTDDQKAKALSDAKAKARYAVKLAAMKANNGSTAGTEALNTDTTYDDGTNYTYAGSSPVGVVTVGSAGKERRIQNVAAGLVSASSTDAMNGSQLYALTRQIRFGGDNSTFGDVATSDVNVVAKGSNEKLAITGGAEGVSNTTTTDGKSVTTVDGTKITDKNIAVIAEDDALHVKLASNLKNLNTAQLGKTTATTTKADDGTETTTYSYQETLKLDGTGDNGGTLALKDAKGENGVTLRTSGATKTADVTGAETNRLLVNDKTVATTDDGLKFGGDTGTDSARKLNSKLTVKGGATTGLSDNNNIGVVSDGKGTLTVKLNKNVNLGTDGSLTTGTVTATTVNATTVKTGDSTLTTSGLSIANGPSVLTSGINAGNKKITSVTAGETDTDAANYGQVKAAKTTLTAQGSNVTITPDTTSDDKHTNYTVSVSNLSYKAGTDTTAKNVTLSNGLTFQNGKNTTAVAGDNGTITYNLNDTIELGAETDSNNHIVVDGTQGLLTLGMDATINGNAGIASIGGVSIGKSGSDQVITGLTNKTWTVGTTQAVDGRAATENQLQSVADNLNTANTNIATLQHGFKVQANGDTTTESTVKADDALNFTAGDNTNVTTTKDSKQITISVDNLSVKDNNGTAQSVTLADGLNFQDGTNTMAVVGTNGSVTYDLKSSITLGTSTDEANRIIVNGTNGTITVGNLATINGNAGTASIGGVSIGKSGSDQTVTGLSNRTWVVGESTAVNGRAATEDQLQSVSNAAYTNANNITMLQQGFTVTTNNDTDKKSTVKAGDNLNFQAGKNVQISTTADSKSIEVALSGTPEFTTVTSKDASGNTTIVSSTGVTITPNGTGAQSVSLTSEGLDNGNHVIKNVASGGDTDTNAANISDVKRLVQASASGTTETGFNVKGDDATAKKVKLGKQLNVVGGTNDTSKLSDGNIGVVTTDDGQGNATLTVKLNKNITLDSVTTGSTTLNTSGVSNGDMSLTNTGFVIKNNDASKQVSVTTSGVSMGSQQIKNVADGTDAKDAVNKGQLDAVQTQVTNGWQIAGSNGQKVADIGAGKKVTFGNTTYATASVQPDGTDGAKVTYTINTAEITDNAKTGVVTAPTTDGVATAQNVAQAINNAAWKIKANDNEATAIKAGTTVGLKAGNNLTLSQSGTDFTYRLNDELTGIKSLTTAAQVGVTTTLAASGVTIASSGTGNKSVSLTANGLNNGGRQITDVASGGDTDTNAANISDVKRLVQASASGTTETGFNVKGDDATAKKVKLGKQLNVVGGTNDTSKLSDGNIGVVTTDDGQGNATLTVKLNKNINLDSVKAGNTTLDTNGVSNGKMNLTGNGMTITDTDPSKQVSVTTNGVSMGSQRIQNVADATQDTDAATLKQVKNARTVVAGGSNVAGVTPAEGANNQMTYTVNVDNLSVKANNEAAKSVTLKNGLTFNNGTNTTASVGDNGEVKYDLNSTLTGLTSVTAGNSTLDTNGLTIKDGAATKVEITSGNVTMGGNVIHNVGAGIDPTDAVNKGQLDALQTQVSGGWNLSGTNSDGTALTAKIGAGKTVTYADGTYTKSVITKDDTTGNATVKVDVTTGTFGSGTGDNAGTVTSTANGLATTQDVANAINSAAINVVADNTPNNKTEVKAGNTIHFAKDDNLTLNQDGTKFTYGLNKEISISKVTTSDATKGSTVQTAEGVTTTDAAGNTYIQNGQGITLTPSDKTKSPVKLTNTGLDNGGNVISGVAEGKQGTDAVNVSQLNKVQDQVGSGWQIAGNDGTKVANIGAGKKVAFKSSSKYLTTSTARSATGESDTGADVTYSLKTTALASGANGTVASIADANDGLVTAQNIATILNSTYWSAAATASGSGSVSGNSTAASIKAGTQVTFTAGNNLSLTQDGTDFTYALLPDLTSMNTIRFGGTLNNGNWSGGLLIGKQAGSGANTAEGNYITGLSNTKWDRATISENSNMAATEGQLKQAIENITTSGSGTGGFGLQADTGNSIMQDLRKTIQIKGDGEGTQEGNIKTSNEGGTLRIRLNKALDLSKDGSVQVGTSKMSNGTIQLGEDTDTYKIRMDSAKGTAAIGGVTVDGANKTVSGLANTTWDADKASQGGYKGSTKAATESQLAEAISTATSTASQDEAHIQSGTYAIGDKSAGATDDHNVSIKVVNGKGDQKGMVTISDVAKASEVGDVGTIAKDIQNKNGDATKPTSVVDAINNLNDKVGDKNYTQVKGKEIADGDSATTAIGKLNNRMNDIYTTAGQHSTVSTADANLTLSEGKNASGGTDYKLGLNKENIDLGNVTINGNAGSIKADSFTAGDTVVNKDGVKVGDKSALTGDSLKVGGKTYVDDKGVDANGQAIRNVGDGKNDGDAVNVKQVNDLAARQGEAIGQNAAHINQLDRAVNRLDSRINRVGAGAAALAALHPGNYDPDDKVDFAAGFGNYRGASAAAVGMYYHPDETTTMSVGASFGGGENMVNAGITWKMGKDSGHMRTQAATKAVPVQFVAAPTQTQQSSGQAEGTKMPQPVTAVTTTASGQQVPIVAAYLPSVDSSTRAENDELKELLARQTAILEKLADQKTAPAQAAAPVSGEDLFPDVPENHWAYDFVAKLAQAGALKDCRVEDPANNPMLTRNDFAQILYTALKNGATKNPALNKDGGLNHLANEFRAELKNVKR